MLDPASAHPYSAEVESLDELRAAVHRDPRQVADAAVLIAMAARERGDLVELSQVLAVRGRALRSLGEIDLGEAVLQDAITVGREARDDDLVADAHVALAGVLSFAGRAPEAFEHLDIADGLGSVRVRAYARLQRAIIEQRLGHLDLALAGYDAALTTLRDLDATTDLALVLMNRGVIKTQTAEYGAAVADLTESGRFFAKGDNEFGVAQTQHGLGWAHARAGDLPTALSFLDEAAGRFRGLGHEGVEVDVDRVETLLAAGLAPEAARLGDVTAQRLAEAGNHSQAAEVWLLCARAALLDDDARRSRHYAGQARAVFERQSSPGWELAARLEVLRSEPATESSTWDGLAAELDHAGNARGAAIAVALAALAAARADDLDRAGALAADAMARAETIGVLEVRMIATHAAATEALGRGDRETAQRLVRAGLDDLQQHRSALAASDARAAVSAHAAALSSLGLSMAVGDSSATDLLDWVERSRGLRTPLVPARPVQEPVAAAQLAELRAVGQELRAGEAAGSDTADLLARQSDLERDIRRRELRERGTGDGSVDEPPTATELADELGGRTLVVMVEVGGRLVAVRVGGPDEHAAALVDLGPAATLRRAADSIASMLRAALRSTTATTATTSTTSTTSGLRFGALRRALDVFDNLVAAALVDTGPVVLVVPPALHTVPWALVRSLAGRPIAVAPSATWWLRASASDRPVAGPVITVAGPRLVEAAREAIAVGECYRDATVLTGDEATVAAVVNAFGAYPLIHVASHVRVRHDNPLWSSLELADGPLYVYDLEHERSTPPLVVLSGCQTGVGVRAGEELVGLSTTLLERGTRRLIASVCELPDSGATRGVMTALHHGIASGHAPAAALARLTASWSSGSSGSPSNDVGAAEVESLIAGSLVSFGLH